VHENIDIAAVTANPHIVLMEPRAGNHFGFYEGGLLQAFSCEDTYTYPARAAKAFFDTILLADDCR